MSRRETIQNLQYTINQLTGHLEQFVEGKYMEILKGEAGWSNPYRFFSLDDANEHLKRATESMKLLKKLTRKNKLLKLKVYKYKNELRKWMRQ